MPNTPNQAVARRWAIRTEARKAFIEMQTCDAIRRATLGRNRVHKGPWEVGTHVYFWRKDRGSGKKDKGTWKGPGVVVGIQQDNIWISVAADAILVAPEQLREAHEEELWAPGHDEVPGY